MKQMKRSMDEDEADILYKAIEKKKRKTFCYRLFNEATEGDSLKIEYVAVISVLLRLAVFI